VVIYANGSCLRSVISVTGLTDILVGWFLGVIKCVKKQLANIVIILKA